MGESGRGAFGSLREAGLTGEGRRVGVGVGGAGVFKYANGNVYDGEWKDSNRNGKGGMRGKGKVGFRN